MALYPLLPMFENVVLHAIWLVLYLMGPADFAKLTDSWDGQSPTQVERAFCANVHIMAYKNPIDSTDLSNGTAIALVSKGSVRSAPDKHADPYHVTPDCPDNDSTIIIHTHTPTTCLADSTSGKDVCQIGGGDAYQCQPSDEDLIWTASRVLRIGGVMCDTHALLMYAPVVKTPPPKKRSQKPVKRLNLGVTARQGPGYAWRLLNRQPSR